MQLKKSNSQDKVMASSPRHIFKRKKKKQTVELNIEGATFLFLFFGGTRGLNSGSCDY
jgi:hypothetical protein